MRRPFISALIAALCGTAAAQTGDAPPVNADQLLQALRQLRDQSTTGLKARRANALQQVMAAASSNEKAAAAWADAVLAVQFAGVDHQTTAVREWKQGDGEALRSKEAANAARLNLHWLTITMQHAAGTETKQLLNSVIEFTRQVEEDAVVMAKTADQIERARVAARTPAANKAVADDERAMKLHNTIMKTSVTEGPVARRLEVTELLADAFGKAKEGDKQGPPGWELVPGNLDGIYNSIILPEFRAKKDPRLLDYWDMILKREAAAIVPGMADFDERRFSQLRRPALLWARAKDLLLLGQKNRAVTEMFNLIKTFPQHPEAMHWISHLESILNSPAPNQPSGAASQTGTAGGRTAPPIPAPEPGSSGGRPGSQ